MTDALLDLPWHRSARVSTADDQFVDLEHRFNGKATEGA